VVNLSLILLGNAMSIKTIKVKMIRSKNGRLASHKACIAGLGLRKIHQTVEVIDTPENRGMINKVHYMLQVEEN
jgi:large subunit ribosomal protein L30